MNWRDARTEKLFSNLVELKLIFEFPKEYLTHHFKGLKNRVDTSALNLISLYNTNKSLIDKINECWELIINKIKQYELDCLTNLHVTNLADENSTTAHRIKQIETKLNNLSENEKSNSTQSTLIEQMLNDELFKLEKIVFQSKCLLYLDNKNGIDFMRDLPSYFIGKLVFVNNDYFEQEKLDLFFK